MDLIFPSFVPSSSFLNWFISQHSKIWFLCLTVSYYTAKKDPQAPPYLYSFKRRFQWEEWQPQISKLLVPKVHSLTSLFYFFLFKVRFIDEYFTYIKFTLFIPFYSSRSFDFCAGSLMTIKSSPNAFDLHTNPFRISSSVTYTTHYLVTTIKQSVLCTFMSPGLPSCFLYKYTSFHVI